MPTAGFRGLTGLLVVLALGPVGCGGPFTGEVSGTVKYKEKPLPGGIVTVLHPDGRTGQAQVQEDGTYSIPNAPGGSVKVTVNTMKPIPSLPGFVHLPGAGKGEPIYPAGKYVPIPGKYATRDSTPLSLEVKRGSQTFDIELTD
jgi:hypothetical protein